MDNVQSMRELLATEYGIKSDRELIEASEKIQKINIGVFVSPIIKAEYGNTPYF